MGKLMAVLAVSAVFGMGMAQEAIPTDIGQWFADTAALAAVVGGLVALIRRHVLPRLDGVAVAAVAVLLGVALAYLGHRMGYLGGDWLVFGATAGLTASGITAWGRSIVRGGQGHAGPDSSDPGGLDRDRTRLR